jgi:hypothetical protein
MKLTSKFAKNQLNKDKQVQDYLKGMSNRDDTEEEKVVGSHLSNGETDQVSIGAQIKQVPYERVNS